jgi:hypothetical protein
MINPAIKQIGAQTGRRTNGTADKGAQGALATGRKRCKLEMGLRFLAIENQNRITAGNGADYEAERIDGAAI